MNNVTAEMMEEAKMNGMDYKPVSYEIFRMKNTLLGLANYPGEGEQVWYDLLDMLSAIRFAFQEHCEKNGWPKPTAFDVHKLDEMIRKFQHQPSEILMPGESEKDAWSFMDKPRWRERRK